MISQELTARDQIIRDLDRGKKADLVTMALAVGQERGQHWALGGPRDWSKDELISYLAPPR